MRSPLPLQKTAVQCSRKPSHLLGAASLSQAGHCAPLGCCCRQPKVASLTRLLITQDRDTGWRSSDSVPAPSVPSPKAAAPGGGGDSTAAAVVAPTSRSARDQVLQALTDSRGMWVDSDAQAEVCVRVDARVLYCMNVSVHMHACPRPCA